MGTLSCPNRFRALSKNWIKLSESIPRSFLNDRAGEWDIVERKVPLSGGAYYWEPVNYPIGACESISEIEANYTFPSADMYDYSVILEQIKAAEGYAIEGGYISLTYFYSQIRGVEQMLVDFLAEPEIAAYILERL